MDGKVSRLNCNIAAALVAALTLTIKDVFRFAEELTLSPETTVPSEQMLVMVDCRSYETRQLYWEASLEYGMGFLHRHWIDAFSLAPEHVATVLLHLYDSQFHEWETGPNEKPSRSLSNQEKDEIPVLVVDAMEQVAFLKRGKEQAIENSDRTCIVVIPGYDAGHVLAGRNKNIQ